MRSRTEHFDGGSARADMLGAAARGARQLNVFIRSAASARPCAPHPDPSAVSRLAQALVKAVFPAIVCSASGADTDAVPLLVALGWGLPAALGHSRRRLIAR